MKLKQQIIIAIFVTALVVSNVVAGKVLNIFGFIVPGAFLLYAVTFLMTDLISELYGKKTANKVVLIGFICTVFAALMILFTKWLPAASFAENVDEAYNTLLGTNLKFVLASMVAYGVSQTWDVWFFDFMGKKTNGKHKWIRNNASTMTSQALDTAIYISIAFAGSVPNLAWMMLSQYLLKICIAAVDTPIFYLLTKGKVNKDFEKTA